MYKVLWFDDEHKTLEDIIENCLLLDIELIGYSNAQDGLEVLLNDPQRFDAILLDGMFLKSETQQTEVKDDAFGEVAKALSNLKAQGVILPWFIYSGQPNFVKDQNKLLELFKEEASAGGKVFDKNDDKDFTELCTQIKIAADQQPHTQVRLQNINAFEVFKLGIIDAKYEHLLSEMLIANLKGDFQKKNINVQRDLLEAIWKGLHFKIPCIPEVFFDTRLNHKPNHEWCTLYFEAKTVNIPNSEPQKVPKYIPKQIGGAFRVLKESVNELSHLNDNTIIKTPLLTNSYLLISILEWLSNFTKEEYPNYI